MVDHEYKFCFKNESSFTFLIMIKINLIIYSNFETEQISLPNCMFLNFYLLKTTWNFIKRVDLFNFKDYNIFQYRLTKNKLISKSSKNYF